MFPHPPLRGGVPPLALAALMTYSCAVGGTAHPDAATPTADAGAARAPRDAATSSPPDATERDASSPSSPSSADTLRVQGRQLLDTCGNPVRLRGVEQVFGYGIDVDGSWLTLVDRIAASGANAMRMLPNLDQLSLSDVDAILARAAGHGLIVYLSPGDRSWFLEQDVRKALTRYTPYLVLDAFQEPDYDDPARWEEDATAAVTALRDAGYREPLCVVANLFGRDLPSALERGPRVVAADPLHNTLIDWQAYWGESGYYQRHYGMTLEEALGKVRAASFPIQLGLTSDADPGDPMDYAKVMALAEQGGVSWLWWNWYGPFGPPVFNLTEDGTTAGLTAIGDEVVRTHADSIERTSVRACTPP